MKWEYKIYMANVANVFTAKPPKDLGVVLDENGAQGWELIKIESINKMRFTGGSYTDIHRRLYEQPSGDSRRLHRGARGSLRQ